MENEDHDEQFSLVGHAVLILLWYTGINYTLWGILLNQNFTKYVCCKSIKVLVRQLLIYWSNTVFTIWVLILILIYLLNAIGLTPNGSSTVHIYTQQYIEQHVIGKSAGCSPPLPVLPWHLPGNWRRSTEKTQSVWNIWCCYLENTNNSFCCRWTLNCWFRMYA